jgi:hypothetical protein
MPGLSAARLATAAARKNTGIVRSRTAMGIRLQG